MNTQTNAGHPFSEAQLELAASNYESQEMLIRDLANAFAMSERTHADVAEELGLSVEEVKSWLDGEVDLALSELRQLANCIDASVTYKVRALRTRYVDKFRDLESHSQWQATPWTPIPVSVP